MAETVDINIQKGGRNIAHALRMRIALVDGAGLEGVQSLHCYFFPRLKLHPTIVFEHLAGTALMHFLHMSELYLGKDGEVFEHHTGLHYTHGRSEVAKGTPSITSVLLVKPKLVHEMPEHGIPLLTWAVWQPLIYSKFLALDREVAATA